MNIIRAARRSSRSAGIEIASAPPRFRVTWGLAAREGSSMKFKVRDLGAVFPTKITDSGFILGVISGPAGSTRDVVLRPDGTMSNVPPGIGRPLDINNLGLVLCRDGLSGSSVSLFDSVTEAIETFPMPGFKYLWPEKLNDSGDVVGSVAKLPDLGDRRGFIRYRQSGSITWVSPTIGPGPDGAAPFLYLNAINNLGHAVGSQGSAGNVRMEVPIYYDGSVHQIGNYAYDAYGDLITLNDRMRLLISYQGSPDTRAIYDRATNSVSIFTYGYILDMTASGLILSQESGGYYLRIGGARHAIASSMGGWSNIYVKSLNAQGLIAGFGQTADGGRGFVLEYDPVGSAVIPGLAGKILWGIINGAGGGELVGGILRHVPPHEPAIDILRVLPRDLAGELSAILEEVPLDGPINEQRFSDRAHAAVMEYARKLRHQSVEEIGGGHR